MALPSRRSLAALAASLCLAGHAHAAPLEYLPVDDPLEAELRVLDLYEPAPTRPALPHLNSRPL